MATWDKADLLLRCQDIAARPTTDEQMTDAKWYRFLTAAQRKWFGVFAVHCPHVLYGAPTIMSTADSGLTYTFSGSITPLAVQIFTTWPSGRLLRPCSAWDSGGDYIWEGSRIRTPNGIALALGAPYARYITPPGVIDASTEPTLLPDHTREILVYEAVADWARTGGMRDPRPFTERRDELAWGNPRLGDPGIIGSLKLQNTFMGETAFGDNGSITAKDYLSEISNYRSV